MPRKTNFKLDAQFFKDKGCGVNIVGDLTKGDKAVYVQFYGKDDTIIGWIEQRDLERFAVNILKALGSKKILSEQELSFVRGQKTRKRLLK